MLASVCNLISKQANNWFGVTGSADDSHFAWNNLWQFCALARWFTLCTGYWKSDDDPAPLVDTEWDEKKRSADHKSAAVAAAAIATVDGSTVPDDDSFETPPPPPPTDPDAVPTGPVAVPSAPVARPLSAIASLPDARPTSISIGEFMAADSAKLLSAVKNPLLRSDSARTALLSGGSKTGPSSAAPIASSGIAHASTNSSVAPPSNLSQSHAAAKKARTFMPAPAPSHPSKKNAH